MNGEDRDFFPDALKYTKFRQVVSMEANSPTGRTDLRSHHQLLLHSHCRFSLRILLPPLTT